MRKLRLRQGIEDIALILAGIRRFFQQVATQNFVVFDAGVMPGRHKIVPKFLRAVVQLIKFQKTVAVDTRIRRTSVFVGGGKPPDHLRLEAIGKIKYVIGDAQPEGHASGILDILQRTAGARVRSAGVLVMKELHGHADTVVPLRFHQIGGNAGVHAAAHRDYSFFIHRFQRHSPPAQCAQESQSGNTL